MHSVVSSAPRDSKLIVPWNLCHVGDSSLVIATIFDEQQDHHCKLIVVVSCCLFGLRVVCIVLVQT